MRTHDSTNVSLYKSQSTWKCAHAEKPHIPPLSHPQLTIYGQCKRPHEYWCTCCSSGEQQQEQKKVWEAVNDVAATNKTIPEIKQNGQTWW